MKNETIEVGGDKWLVREATSLDQAEYAIAMARCSGSVGSRHIEINGGVETITADVIRLNADGSLPA